MILAATVLMAASCAEKAGISGTLEGVSDSEIVVKLLNVNRYEVVDTVAVNAQGGFECKVDVKEGQPEFFYLFYNDTRVASLLLQNGDNVSVTADTLGKFSVTGAPEAEKLVQVEADYAKVLSEMTSIAQELQNLDQNSEQADELKRRMSRMYVDYYRDRVKYIMGNSHSLTVVPVLYQSLGDGLPVFAQSTDAIHFLNASDSLETVYPESRYVKALRDEAENRRLTLELQTKIAAAPEVGFPDIELPDIKANKIKLSDVDSKVVMVFFWTAVNAQQKMFNLDVLAPLYEKYHDKGFEIYQVSLDSDKALWAKVVKEQNLPWINVCDSRSVASPYMTLYNVTALPSIYMIKDGELIEGKNVSQKSLESVLKAIL